MIHLLVKLRWHSPRTPAELDAILRKRLAAERADEQQRAWKKVA